MIIMNVVDATILWRNILKQTAKSGYRFDLHSDMKAMLYRLSCSAVSHAALFLEKNYINLNAFENKRSWKKSFFALVVTVDGEKICFVYRPGTFPFWPIHQLLSSPAKNEPLSDEFFDSLITIEYNECFYNPNKRLGMQIVNAVKNGLPPKIGVLLT